jgi:predicted SAM-dependent methyltransferase
VLDGVLREHPSIQFLQQDVADFRPDRRWGVLASADFLEHLPPATLPDVLSRLHAAADASYHKIACYDDGHSHLSVFTPREWLDRFQQACPGAGYRIVKTTVRKRGQEVVVISNLPGGVASMDAEAAVGPGMRLDVGCGPKVRPGHVGVDVRALPGVGIVCDAWELDARLAPHSVESIYCRHFFEHLTFAQGRRTLQGFHRVLRPGGELQVIVPDLRYHMRQYLEAKPSTRSDANAKWSARQHALASLFGWQRDGERELWDVHKAGYDQATLTEALIAAGFGRVRRLPEQPWHLSVTAVAE